MGNEPPPGDLVPWIPTGKHDVYAIGVQECEYHPRAPHATTALDWFAAIETAIGPGYQRAGSQSLWAMRLVVFVRDSFAHRLREVEVSSEATGVAHVAGNKGGIALALTIDDTSFCFVNSHLAAHQQKIAERNSDYYEILGGIQLGLKDVDITNQYDHVFWMGDLNYRIEGDRDEVVSLIASESWEQLYQRDQLHQQMTAGNVFHGFTEPPPQFRPTYKYVVGLCSEYTDKKSRVPSWCDRVLHHPRHGFTAERLSWTACDMLTTSDHHPVAALFSLQTRHPYVPPVPPDLTSISHHGFPAGCKFVIRQLHGLALKVADVNGLSDPYITFVAPWLEPVAKTTVKRRSLSPSWEDDQVPVLKPFICDRVFLENAVVMLQIWDYDAVTEDDRMGQALLPLKGCLGGDCCPFDLVVRDGGLAYGRLRGTIQCVWDDAQGSGEAH